MTTSDAALRQLGVRQKSIGLGAAIVAAVLWGFGGIIAAISTTPVLVFTYYRLWVGVILLTALTYATGHRLTWRTMKASWLGGLFYAGDLVMFFSAVRLTSIVVATLIGAFQPALVFLAARKMFGERSGRWDVFWIVLAMVGVVLTVVGAKSHGHRALDGDLLAFGSLLCWTGYWLVSKRTSKNHDAMEYTTDVTIMAALVLTPVVLLSGQHLGGLKGGDWFWIVLMAVVPGSGHLIMNWAHRFVDASVSSVIGNLNALVAAVAAVIFLGQVMTPLQILGVVIGLLAIAVVAARQREPARSPLE
jgi:drug/metabolite transporter (DMT)-like permease